MSSSSDNESDNEKVVPSRLGECEVCGANEAIYTCPKCEVKTCCLDCVRIHKKELECTGIRDRTKFIRMNDFTDTDLLSDYRLLEQCARFVYAVKRDEKKKYSRIDKDLPIHLYKLRMAAMKRGTILQYLTQNFSKHKVNTTRYNYKSNTISWRVEWVFPNVEAKPLKFVDEKCLESKKLSELIAKYLDPNAAPFEGSKDLVYYKAVGFSGVKVLLKAEKVKGSSKKFFELDTSESLAENLSGKCIVEFPIIFIVLKDHSYNFEIITPEDEFDYDNKHEVNMDESTKGEGEITKSMETLNSDTSQMKPETGHQRKRQKTLLTEKIAEEKKKEIEKEIKEQKKKQPKNLLFTTGYSSEESVSCSEDENEEK
ncbi:box C/D snoRNA protein 1 [Danaus plexippus plexippus]|uniref:Box C/D snoRNA protein 1 n=1 Tax=Danaus plexippus plexippus TaxID=278856 RepID=A0A212F5E4_DANPL|nr:box C/D snoRNA protein 1 [Danaus plexippus plexippus]